MNDYRVAKLETPASLYLTNSTVVRGTLFLAEFSATHSGHETVLDLVRSSSPMLPMHDQAGRFFLVGRQHIVGTEVSAGSAGAKNLVSSVPARIETTGGHIFQGRLSIPAGMGDRISDALNGDFDWHALQTGSVITWLSRQHIIKAHTDS